MKSIQGRAALCLARAGVGVGSEDTWVQTSIVRSELRYSHVIMQLMQPLCDQLAGEKRSCWQKLSSYSLLFSLPVQARVPLTDLAEELIAKQSSEAENPSLSL